MTIKCTTRERAVGAEYDVWRRSKALMRSHPEWTDADIARELHLPAFDLRIVREARKDYQAAEAGLQRD
jgi:hypothetical protein